MRLINGKTAVASPDDQQAQAVLKRQNNKSNSGFWEFCFLVLLLPASISLLAALVIDTNNLAWVIAITLWVLASISAVVMNLTSAERAYNKLLKRDRILELDPLLIGIWDGMRNEEGVTLTTEQRDLALDVLYYEARVSRPLTDELALARQQPTRIADQQMTEARIRAVLRPAVRQLKSNHNTDQQLAAHHRLALEGSPTESDILSELRIIQRRGYQQ